MSETRRPARNRLVLVERDRHAGLVLERAMAARGWVVSHSESGRGLTPDVTRACDVVLLALDGDDTDIFETLLSLASDSHRPSVVLLTRRADARVLSRQVLASLGVDRVIRWPSRIEQIDAAIAAALEAHDPARLVS